MEQAGFAICALTTFLGGSRYSKIDALVSANLSLTAQMATVHIATMSFARRVNHVELR